MGFNLFRSSTAQTTANALPDEVITALNAAFESAGIDLTASNASTGGVDYTDGDGVVQVKQQLYGSDTHVNVLLASVMTNFVTYASPGPNYYAWILSCGGTVVFYHSLQNAAPVIGIIFTKDNNGKIMVCATPGGASPNFLNIENPKAFSFGDTAILSLTATPVANDIITGFQWPSVSGYAPGLTYCPVSCAEANAAGLTMPGTINGIPAYRLTGAIIITEV